MFILYGLEYCPYCIKAVQLFEINNIPVKIIWVKPEEKEKYKKKNGMNTFPQIFFTKSRNNRNNRNNGNKGKMVKIGGCDDIENMFVVARVINQRNLNFPALSFLSSNM